MHTLTSCALPQALAQHMVDRHGLAEVTSWRWEVWK
jgi:hypothetical protein|eukprot:COSAG01_NODE_5122_length_4471_cov_2.591263_2_plen_36_part_00